MTAQSTDKAHQQMDLRRGDLMEYHGQSSSTIPPNTVVRVQCQATSKKTVVEARGQDGTVVNLVLANKYLQQLRSLF